MAIFKKNLSKKTKTSLALFILVVLVLCAYIVWDITATGPLTSLLSNRDKVISTVRSLGIFSPLIYIFLQILQTIFAPIPGQVVGAVGGYLFGWWGIPLTIIGSAIGFFIVFSLSRRFGRTLVEKIFKKSAIDRFDFLTSSHHATFAMFLIFLLPGFPDDMVCYIAGLTDIPIKKLMTLIIIGRIPTVIVTNYVGAGLGKANYFPIIVAAILVVALLLVIVLNEAKIIAYLKHKVEEHKENKA